MDRSRWIVVGMDFSDGAMLALDCALGHAAVLGASVACVHAYEDAPGTPAFHDPAPGIREQLKGVISLRAPATCGVLVEPIVRRGAPWEKLANVATELGADIIVVGACGQRGASGLLGSVVTRLLATSRRSVLVVPSPDARAG